MEIFIGLMLGLVFGYFWGKGEGYSKGKSDERYLWTNTLDLNDFDPEFEEIVDQIKSAISDKEQLAAKMAFKMFIRKGSSN